MGILDAFARRRRSVPKPGGMSFSSRLLIQQIAIILLIMLLSSGIYGWLTYQRLVAEVGAKTLAVAQSLAEDEDLKRILDADRTPPDPSTLPAGPVQAHAEVVRARIDALFVVVTDRNGIRLAHPDPSRLGEMVSTDHSAALSGEEVTVQEVGTLGPSVRSKVPVYAADREIVGEVSVGYSTTDILDAMWLSVGPIVAVAGFAVLLGAGGSALLMRRLRKVTLGLQPEEIGELVKDQEVVLYGVDEGVIGVSADRRLTICNDKAKRLLNLPEAAGQPLAELDFPPAMLALLEQESGQESAQMLVGATVLIVSVRKVVHSGQDLGWVVMVRDRTDVQELSRQLDAVGTLSQALRAQRHEFANRLHAVSGLLDIGQPAEASAYLRRTLETGPLKYPLENGGLLTDTFLLAFLGAKSTQSAERGVNLRLGQNTLLHSPLADAQDVTTVLGNLVDNAITAAVQGTSPDRWVEVELLSDRGTLHLTVSDSGDGIPEQLRGSLFEEGISSAGAGYSAGRGEGIGLGLARQLARLGGGELRLLSAGTPGGPGAVFVARMERVLEETIMGGQVD